MAHHPHHPHRSTSPPTRAELQALLDGEQSAWRKRDDETWQAFVRRKAPPEPSFFKIGERAAYQVALAEALRVGEQRVARRALFFPLWIGDNEDEVPRSDVWRRHLLLVVADGEGLLQLELPEGPPFWARVELTVTSGAFVVPSRSYAPDIPLKRFGPYAVCPSAVRTVVEVVEACAFGPATPAPAREIPAFFALAEPAMDLALLPLDVAQLIANTARAMQTLIDDEGVVTQGGGP